MITSNGYSKDPTIIPEGIVITFGKDMINEQGGLLCFLRCFLECVSGEDDDRYWMHKCSNLPTKDVLHVYIIISNRLYGRVPFAGYHRPEELEYGYSANGEEKIIDWPYLILAGPIEKSPFKRKLKGFQGFRYCTKLF